MHGVLSGSTIPTESGPKSNGNSPELEPHSQM